MLKTAFICSDYNHYCVNDVENQILMVFDKCSLIHKIMLNKIMVGFLSFRPLQI